MPQKWPGRQPPIIRPDAVPFAAPPSTPQWVIMDLSRQLDNLYLLVRIIDAGGFSAAARDMGTTRSLLSRRMKTLENALGVQLLHRDARHFAVTAAGEKVYRHAVAMHECAQAALEAVHDSRHGGHRQLRIGMRDTLSPLFSDMLAAYASRQSGMRLSIDSQHGTVNLLRQYADVLLHLGDTLPDSSDIVAHPLGRARLVVVASPALLRDLGHPRHPDDIPSDRRMAFTGFGPTPRWTLRGTRPASAAWGLASSLVAPLLKAARAGKGLVQLPMYTCHRELASGHLETTFDAFEALPLPLYALTPSTRKDSGVQDFIRHVRKQLLSRAAHGILPP